MAVDAGAERGLGVVEVKHGETLQSDHPVELGEGFLRALGSREIVSGGEGVGCVEADLEPLRILHGGKDLSDFFEGSP